MYSKFLISVRFWELINNHLWLSFSKAILKRPFHFYPVITSENASRLPALSEKATGQFFEAGIHQQIWGCVNVGGALSHQGTLSVQINLLKLPSMFA